jgi:hypothetical protein
MKTGEDDFRRRYAEVNDDGLLATNREELVGVARRCYDDELAKRGLDNGSHTRPEHHSEAEEGRSKTFGRLRILGTFILGVAVAVFGTAIVDSPFERYTVGASLRASMFRMDVLTGCFAFGLGYGVFRTWKLKTSRWVWIAGLCWFGQRSLLPPDGIHVLSWETVATRSAFTDWVAMGNWSIYMLPLVRTVFYSAGAFACSVIASRSRRSA